MTTSNPRFNSKHPSGLFFAAVLCLAMVRSGLGCERAESPTSSDPPTISLPASTALSRPGNATGPSRLLRLRPYILDAVRARAPVASSLEVNFAGRPDQQVTLRKLRVLHEGDLLTEKDLAESLSGDEGRFLRINQLLETLPPDTSYRYNHRDTPLSAVLRDLDEIHRVEQELDELVKETTAFERRLPFPSTRVVKFALPLDRIFSPQTFVPGRSETILLELTYEEDATSKTVTVTHSITVASTLPHARLWPDSKGRARVDAVGAWHYGDLHVHDCKDEAGFWRGCPACEAESLNFGDDNSLADLKSQYTALGATWFTSSSHSYCINSTIEYQEVDTEAASLSGPDFLVVPDTELTSLEEGPQSGSDTGDWLCLAGSNHMGAHWIQTWKPGGDDRFLGICADPISGFTANVNAILAEGGFAIAHHPTSDAWAFNSEAWFKGFGLPHRRGGFQGVEIWNGPVQSGQGGHVDWWVRMLLRGEWLYAYSGSDTHDDVFDFGWNHAYLTEPFSSDALASAIRSGHLYISNYQSINLLARIAGTTRWNMMGSIIPVPAQGTTNLELAVSYDMGTRTGSITLYEGHVNDSAETVLCSFAAVSGSGIKTCTDVAFAGSRSHYRAHSETTDGFSAYSNPIFVLPH